MALVDLGAQTTPPLFLYHHFLVIHSLPAMLFLNQLH
jgi:hypothetical protein